MRFRLVEEALEEQKEKLRGQTEAKEVVCALVRHITGMNLNPEDWMLHHVDGNHDNYTITNLNLVRKSSRYGSSTHNLLHANKDVPAQDVIKLADLL